MQAKQETNSQWALLAGLRLVLASVVVCSHYYFVARFGVEMPAPLFFLGRCGGLAAVLCFFVISGFSIAASVERGTPAQFYARRAWRIYPVYLTCFALAFVPFLVGGGGFKLYNGAYVEIPVNPLQTIPAALGLTCLLAAAPGAFGQSWSLQCEIVYYALAPILRKFGVKILIAIVILSFALMTVRGGIYSQGLAGLLYGINIAQLAWAWLAGFLYYRYRSNPNSAALLIIACAVLPPFLPANGGGKPFGRWTMLATVLCLVYGDRLTISSDMRRLLNIAGDVSYPLYLSHLSVLCSLYLWMPIWMPAHSSVYFLASLVVAFVILYCVDYPCRRIARRSGDGSTAGRQNE